MAVAAKYQRFRNKCQRCQGMFGCWRKAQRYCSQKCSANDRVEHQRRAGRTAGQLSARRRWTKLLADIRAIWPGMPDDAVRLLLESRRKWWLAGWRVGDKNGFRRGYADALGEAPEIQWRKRRAA